MRLTRLQRNMLDQALRNEANENFGHRGAWVERYAEPPFNYRTGESLISKGLMRQSLRTLTGSYGSTVAYGFEITDAGRIFILENTTTSLHLRRFLISHWAMDTDTTLEESPFFKTAELPRPETISSWPSVSLFVMAKNASSCIGRLLDSLVISASDGNLRSCVSEIVMVLNDTEDGTARIVEDFGRKWEIEVRFKNVTERDFPELYIMDEAATYQIGASLCGESFDGPFLDKPILADWAAARNTMWSECKGDWRLFLDADDVVQDSDSIPGLCQLLTAQGVEQACTSYVYSTDENGRPRESSMRERLARNVSHINWAYPIHEVLVGALRTAHVQGNLIVCDMKDNSGLGTRIPGRNFKVLYHHARSHDWEVSPRILAHLIMEIKHLIGTDGVLTPTMLSFAKKLLELHLSRSMWPEERGWTQAEVGELHEGNENWAEACRYYEASLEEHPGAKTAYRLCRARFMLSDWKGSLEAFDLGRANKLVHQSLEDGALHEEMSKILAASAAAELGQTDRAKELCLEALVAFPHVAALKDLAERLGVKTGEI